MSPQYRLPTGKNITQESTNKVILNEIQFESNPVSTAKITNNDANLLEITNKTLCKTKFRPIKASTENEATIRLTVILINRNRLKQAFWDAVRIRYNIPLQLLPIPCVYRRSFKLQHALSCP